jgi:hypothetical protein
MAQTKENQARRDWIESGEMNGDNDAIMNTLLNNLPATSSMSAAELALWQQSHNLMAELWLRGISKKQFIRAVKLPRQRSKKV